MAKFELNVYDVKTGEVSKTVQRNFMPVNLFIRFQQLSERLLKNEIEGDAVLFSELKPLFVETFSDLTVKEYDENVDIAEALVLFKNILEKSTKITSNSKNA